MKTTFVVLHYESLEDTKECIDSLKAYLSEDSVQIVVVDNGSKKGRLTDIESEYLDEKIHFLYSKENLGFANGNNLGFRFAKEELKADIIVLANNDLVFEQKDFMKFLLNRYSESQFDIAGPRIMSLVDGKNQNPVEVQYKEIKDVNIRLIKYYILYFLSVFNLDTSFQKIFSKEIPEVSCDEVDDYQLHGACMIFGKNYIDHYDGLYNKTFMYGEEGILKFISKRDKLKMIYIDDLVVFHKEGSSTGKVYGKGRTKRQFYYKWNIHSCKLLRNLMKNCK